MYFCRLYLWLYYKPLYTLWSFFPSTFYYLLRKSKRDKIMSFVLIHILIISKYSFLSRGFGFPFGVTLSLFEGHLSVILIVQNYSFQILWTLIYLQIPLFCLFKKYFHLIRNYNLTDFSFSTISLVQQDAVPLFSQAPKSCTICFLTCEKVSSYNLSSFIVSHKEVRLVRDTWLWLNA